MQMLGERTSATGGQHNEDSIRDSSQEDAGIHEVRHQAVRALPPAIQAQELPTRILRKAGLSEGAEGSSEQKTAQGIRRTA